MPARKGVSIANRRDREQETGVASKKRRVEVRRVLVPVDGFACSERAVQEVIELAKGGASLDVQVLNVQPRVFVEETFTDIPMTLVRIQPAIDFSGRLQAM